MRYVCPGAWKLALPGYALIGLFAGSGWAQRLADAAWKKPGLGTFAVVNLLLPAAAAAMAVAYPRWWTVIAGAGLLTLGMMASTIGRLFTPCFWQWTFPMWLQAAHPILVAATVGYAAIGLMVVAALRPWRRVGEPPVEGLCECGYPREGLDDGPCPECGRISTPKIA